MEEPLTRYWLIKSEAEKYAWSDLLRDGETVWDGVRNHRAANNMRMMQPGERAFFYHSVSGKEIIGIAAVGQTGLLDPTDADGKWPTVTFRPVAPLARAVTLAEIKAEPGLASVELIRLSRLSVAEILPEEWERIVAMGGGVVPAC